jgi:hypothetical protein
VTNDVLPEHPGWRRLAAAVLLRGCLDARSDYHAAVWLRSEQAHSLADLLGLERWPPELGQLAGRPEWVRRARAEPEPELDDDDGGLSLRGKAYDKAPGWQWRQYADVLPDDGENACGPGMRQHSR